MAEIPQVPSPCTGDAALIKSQVARYRAAGEGAEVLARTPRILALRLSADANLDSVAQAVAVERECCPFYEIQFDREARELTFAVSQSDQEPALEGIADAFGLSPVRA
jgi:hypothetical protein